MDALQQLRDRIPGAATRLAAHVVPTRCFRLPNSTCWTKCEHEQHTGSFKLRGALNKLLLLDEGAAARGVVAASAGNHGVAVAYAASIRGIAATVVVPADAVAVKKRAIESYGASLVEADGGFAGAEEAGKRLAQRTGAVWISPYNDLEVIAGQATLGLELAHQLPMTSDGPTWTVYVPASGGGLVSGIAAALRWKAPEARVVGVQMAAAPYLHAYFHHGTVGQVNERPTLADGLAGAVESGSITFDLIAALLDDIVLVEEGEMLEALAWSLKLLERPIEPAAAAALAALRLQTGEGPAVAVLSGGNVDERLLERLVDERNS